MELSFTAISETTKKTTLSSGSAIHQSYLVFGRPPLAGFLSALDIVEVIFSVKKSKRKTASCPEADKHGKANFEFPIQERYFSGTSTPRFLSASA